MGVTNELAVHNMDRARARYETYNSRPLQVTVTRNLLCGRLVLATSIQYKHSINTCSSSHSCYGSDRHDHFVINTPEDELQYSMVVVVVACLWFILPTGSAIR